MNKLLYLKKPFIVAILTICVQVCEAQFLMDMIDTTTSMGKGLLNMYSRFDRLRLGGYIQPQFQVAQSKGAKSFEGGDFTANSNNRFMLRRARVRIDYVHSNKDLQPSMQFAFQFDANERAFSVRDVWARLFENKWQFFAFTTGMFARPFGFEVNLSSQDRESPERGRMSQILMKSERDLGAMLTFDSRKKNSKWKFIKVDLGFFNGQGINGPTDYDSYKDFIGKVAIKPIHLSRRITLSAALSHLNGGIIQSNKFRYKTESSGLSAKETIDSSASNIGTKNPRIYYGVDAQLKWKHAWGFTELRAEYIWGTQTAGANTTETPAVLLPATEGYHVRKFNGAYFYFLQHIVNSHHQIAVKYDWYDPNSKASGMAIGQLGSGLSAANIRYSSLGTGYNFYFNENVKLMLWYHFVKNESTRLDGFTEDVKDNILTCRLQYRF